MRTAEQIVKAIQTAFPDTEERPTVEQVETTMRPLAPEAFLLRKDIQNLLGRRSKSYYPVASWMEANLVVSGTGKDQQEAVIFLLMDTCTCVLDHLREALAHATDPDSVDDRIADLVNHPYLKKG